MYVVAGRGLLLCDIYTPTGSTKLNPIGSRWWSLLLKFKGKVMDDKIFMYFESTDMCFNTIRNNEKIYAILNIKFDHMGLQSSDIKYSFEIIKNRNWHYCWSKFYYYKKNFNYILAISKITPNIIKSITTMAKSFIKKDHVSYEHSKAELSGIMSSLLNKKSYYRPKIY